MTDSTGSRHKEDTGLALPAEPASGVCARVDSDATAVPRLEEIFRDYFDFVFAGLRRLGVPASSLDDAVQDVFVVVHRRGREFEGRSSVKTWLYGIALRVAHDHRRRQVRVAAQERLAEAMEDNRPSPQDAAATAEGMRLLEEILAGLDEEKRDVLALADLEGLTASEIAQVVGVPVNTVYSRLRVARALLNEAVARRQTERK